MECGGEILCGVDRGVDLAAEDGGLNCAGEYTASADLGQR
jgi:hypothetical protein